jgi:hypothetical protein
MWHPGTVRPALRDRRSSLLDVGCLRYCSGPDRDFSRGGGVDDYLAQPRAFSTSVKDDILTVTLHRNFDSGRLNQDWGQFVVASHPGPFAQVRLELAECGRLNSTFIAGLVRLYAAYANQGTQRVVLVDPDKRLLANLKMLRFDQYFVVA